MRAGRRAGARFKYDKKESSSEEAIVNYWLMKSEPTVYSIADLQREHQTIWEGVRNYQARNFLREMKVGDLARDTPRNCRINADCQN